MRVQTRIIHNKELESKVHMHLINHAISQKHAFEQWKKVANFMIFKEPGNTKTHRLRVIHRYEADLNLIWGVNWQALTHHGIDNHLFSPWQFGGLPGQDTLTPILQLRDHPF
jgi:hypothetical protein